ncbi:hypothetical protein D3C80_25480 [compost metagenome]|uniref:hypothetical protein n=1 Tax=Raoultella TaxID=160674 RepID=UPI000FBC5BA9
MPARLHAEFHARLSSTRIFLTAGVNELSGRCHAFVYQQADYDAGVRIMCRSAGKTQRNGVPLERMKENINLAEGIGPEMRYQMVKVAEACWTLSKNGIPDGTTQIRSMY